MSRLDIANKLLEILQENNYAYIFIQTDNGDFKIDPVEDEIKMLEYKLSIKGIDSHTIIDYDSIKNIV